MLQPGTRFIKAKIFNQTAPGDAGSYALGAMGAPLAAAQPGTSIIARRWISIARELCREGWRNGQ
jgi:ATP-dependent protease HslVU (ClpYQ) peptidase subunit